MADASQEALECKTLFLKVSIHCEGCKKKVRRVLQKMDGVYKVDIDSFQHKVTVTGNVDHDMLIRRLLKSGKQASVWPEVKIPGGNPTPAAASSSESKNKNKESNNNKAKAKEAKESSENPKEKQPEPGKEKSSEEEGNEKEVKEKEKPKNEDGAKTNNPPVKEKEKEKEREKDVEKEKPKEKEKEKEKPKEQSEKEATESSNSGKKKKEKKEQKENHESGGKEGGQQVERGISPSEPKQEFMHNPYSYPYPPQPIMSYHVAQPSSSQAYYQQPPMNGLQGYMYPNAYPNPNPYSYQNPYAYGAPPAESNYGASESSMRGDHDALSYFNDENANSCSLM